MRNELHIRLKWLQIALCCIHGFGTKWTCCHIARKPRGREEGCWKQTGMLRPPDPLRGIEYCIETASVLASSSEGAFIARKSGTPATFTRNCGGPHQTQDRDTQKIGHRENGQKREKLLPLVFPSPSAFLPTMRDMTTIPAKKGHFHPSCSFCC